MDRIQRFFTLVIAITSSTLDPRYSCPSRKKQRTLREISYFAQYKQRKRIPVIVRPEQGARIFLTRELESTLLKHNQDKEKANVIGWGLDIWIHFHCPSFKAMDVLLSVNSSDRLGGSEISPSERRGKYSSTDNEESTQTDRDPNSFHCQTEELQAFCL